LLLVICGLVALATTIPWVVVPTWRHYLFTLLSGAVDYFLPTVGTSGIGFHSYWAIPILVVIVGVSLVRYQHGKAAMLTHWGEAKLATRVILIALSVYFIPIFCWSFVKNAYNTHMTLGGENQRVREKNNLLSVELEKKRQNLQTSDPAFLNMTNTIRAFMIYRKEIGPKATCRILVTVPKDEDSSMFMPFITFAVFASNCPNGDLQNIGIKPENVDDELLKGMVPGVLVLHAPPGAKGADRLTNNLSNLIQTRRVYTLPAKAPDNTIWIQFGTHTKWNTEQ